MGPPEAPAASPMMGHGAFLQADTLAALGGTHSTQMGNWVHPMAGGLVEHMHQSALPGQEMGSPQTPTWYG